jgi:hypothetical protein
MSAEMVQSVFDDATVVNVPDRLVLIAIAWKYDPRKGCFPSIDMLKTMTMLDRATVYRALGRLEESGKITIKHGGKGRGARNYYALGYTPKKKSSKIIEADFKQPEPGEIIPPDTVNPAATGNPKMVPKKSGAKKSKKLDLDAVQFPAGFDTPELRAAIMGWAEARKHPPTTHACNLALSTVRDLGVQKAIDEFNRSALAGWSGLFPLKQNQNGIKPTQSAPKNYKTVD